MHPVFVLEAAMRLKGKVLKKESNSYDGDYSGGSVYHDSRTAIYLYEDNSFLYEEKSFSSVSSGGLSLPSESKRQQEGTWKAEAHEEKVHLVLRLSDDSIFRMWATRDGGTGVEYLDDVAWNRYRIS